MSYTKDDVDDEMSESKILYLEQAIDIVQQIFAKSTIFITFCYIFFLCLPITVSYLCISRIYYEIVTLRVIE